MPDPSQKRFFFITTSFYPVGGVIKILDYAVHALDLDHEIVICCDTPYDEKLPLFESGRFRHLSPRRGVRFMPLSAIRIGPRDLVFFSWPPHFDVIRQNLLPGTVPEQVIHIVQGLCHADPSFIGGYALRLLTVPLARIVISELVLEAVKPFLNQDSYTKVILLGHDAPFFSKQRTGGIPAPANVAHTTWKSGIGDRIEAQLLNGPFRFRAVRHTADWEELRRLYHWADMFLCTPGPEEGFYLPGLEAMSAGAIVLTPDVGGNLVYCRFGENCFQVELENESSYITVLKSLVRKSHDQIDKVRQMGYRTVKQHELSREKERFLSFVARLEDRIASAQRYPK
jgi:hypothetical protein